MFDLLFAAAIGDLATVQRCLERARRIDQLEAELSRTCGRGRCALHVATLSGHCSIVAALLKAGAPPTAQDKDGCTAIMHACRRGQVEALAVLLQTPPGPKLSHRARDGRSAVHFAAQQQSAACLRLLLQAGASPAVLDHAGASPLMAACIAGSVEAVRALVEVGVDVNTGRKHCTGDSPLHVAARQGNATILEILLTQKAVMSWQDNNGNTVLHACATCEHRQKRWECARVLLAEKRLPLQVLNGKHQTAADICNDVDLREAMRHAMEGARLSKPALAAEPCAEEGDVTPDAHTQQSSEQHCTVRSPFLTAQQRAQRAHARCLHSSLGSCMVERADATGHAFAASVAHTDGCEVSLDTSNPQFGACAERGQAASETPAGLDGRGRVGLCVSMLPAELARPRAGKLSALETWQARPNTLHSTPAPFAVDTDVGASGHSQPPASCDNQGARAKRACVLEQERAVWAATRLQRPETARMRRACAELRAADAMWFDAASPLTHSIPVRACLGRYSS